MSSQMIIRIDSSKKEKLKKLSKSEGKTTSEVIRELIDSYLMEHDISGYIDNLWGRINILFKGKGYSQKSIQRFIKESRKNNK